MVYRLEIVKGNTPAEWPYSVYIIDESGRAICEGHGNKLKFAMHRAISMLLESRLW